MLKLLTIIRDKIGGQLHSVLFLIGLGCFLKVAFMTDIKLGIGCIGAFCILISLLLSRLGGE
ncbi:hypothetical protein [Lactococcus garvieae]|uniref:Uncharacterized protein n=1 Tax=Lactococcus garvieae TaxID=1363 RepID=A0A1I4I6L6_9LACT|nr:hypothetical protein [Lactococcus garvieae]SFL49411.1 hypothetical protein SAMN05216438_11312 [Lactococcus garvieae]